MKPSVQEQLNLLKGMTIRTGSIHEAQALQLRNWPLLIPNVEHSEARVDAENRTVLFLCKTPKGTRLTKKAAKTCENICEWVRNILWDDTKVVIKIDGKKVFDSALK